MGKSDTRVKWIRVSEVSWARAHLGMWEVIFIETSLNVRVDSHCLSGQIKGKLKNIYIMYFDSIYLFSERDPL